MLSIASKRTIPIAIPRQGLRNAAKQQQHSRLTTASAPPAASSNNRLVVSRRAWLEFKESRRISRKKPDPSKKPASNDEKPWPRNMQIAGYVAGAVAVPYTILWTITSNPTLREWFGPYIPLDKFRTWFGKLEWDAQSYTEDMEDARKREKDGKAANSVKESLIGRYQFPEEDPFHVRQQQEIIENLEESDVAVTISASSSPSQMADIVTTTVVAKTVASEKKLLELFSSGSASANTNGMMVAVDFLDQNNPEHKTDDDTVKTTKPLSDGSLMTDIESSMANTKWLSDSPPASQQLAQETQTLSKWTYTPSQQQGSGEASNAGDSGTTQMTDVEIKMGHLEYDISELEKSLRDPMCTRNIDDMTTELSKAKRELSKLKWKRRFGLV